jgi:hypothetical protein
VKRGVAIGAAFALTGGLLATQAGPAGVSASSHREAPLIAGDPRADNTDVYAFVSPDAPDTVSLIANWLPFSEPNGGPNFYPWADGARYNIHVDNDGDAVADLTYTWVFDTVIKDDGQFLVNTGPFDSVNDATLNVYQTYDLTVSDGGAPTVLLDDAIAAPSSVGAVSTPNYQPLVDEAVASGTSGDLKSYAGQADDSFFLDLRVFDLLYGANVVPEVGEDTLAGYNVNTIALQVPKAELALGGDDGANPVIGVWSTTEREVRDDTGALGFVQVSRLGNPLINEVVIPLALKDTFNAVDPTVDATVPAVVDAVVNPILPELIEAIYGVPAPDEDRNDLVEIFLQGISEENAGLTGAPGDNPALNVDLNSLGLNAGAGAIVPSEMLRLNMSVPPTASPNNFGVLAGDLAGFPNGRRLADDVVDIALQVVQGAAISGQLNPALLPFDSVDRNDRDFESSFPYVALPHLDSVNNGTERTPRAPEIVSISPVRVLETRALATQIGYSGPKPAAGQIVEVQVVGAPGSPVPGDAKAVVVNVTAVESLSNGFVTVFPCGQAVPTASSLNTQAARVTHGTAISALGTDGKICLFTSDATDLLVDLMAFHPSTAAQTANVPERVLDTRNAIGFAGEKPAAGSVTTVTVTGTARANLPADTKAVFVNVTSVDPESDGYVTVYSCDVPRPANGSNLNLVTGIAARSNLTVSQISAAGTVCIYSTSATQLIVDLQGAAPAASTFVPTVPERVLETRAGAGLINYSGAKPIAGQTIEVKVAGFGNAAIPDDAGTVYLNVTATGTSDTGFITVYPCGSALPTASNVNLTGIDTPNLVAASIGDGGRVCLYVSDPTHVVADILGYFPGTILG